MKLFVTLMMLVSLASVASEGAKKHTKKKTAKKETVATAAKKEADCDKPKDEFLKKIEAEKKARAEAGKGLSLQGAKDTGCSL